MQIPFLHIAIKYTVTIHLIIFIVITLYLAFLTNRYLLYKYGMELLLFGLTNVLTSHKIFYLIVLRQMLLLDNYLHCLAILKHHILFVKKHELFGRKVFLSYNKL